MTTPENKTRTVKGHGINVHEQWRNSTVYLSEWLYFAFVTIELLLQGLHPMDHRIRHGTQPKAYETE